MKVSLHVRASLVRTIYDAIYAPPSRDSRYGIAAGYRHRKRTLYFDGTAETDEWQREVYVAAADLMRSQGLCTVYDVGCGSGYKLVHYLGEYETTGFEIEPTLTFLNRTYPDRRWRLVTLGDRSLPPANLVVCADVIEHVDDPDALLNLLRHLTGEFLILSTPERDLVYAEGDRRRRCGPPWNITHVREWSFAEFGSYVGSRFDIVEHLVTNREQATQMVVCRNRASG
jgi:SAM-dependent methyltransferase